jgi:hypothetical protein
LLRLAPDGVLTRQGVVAAGLAGDLPRPAGATGDGHAVGPSTYLLTDGPVTDEQLIAAALAHAGRDLVVTGPLACRLIGLADVPSESAVDVLVPASRRRVSTPYVRVHPTTRPPGWWRQLSGARVAEPHRAVVDTCRRLAGLRDVRALLLGTVASGCCHVDELQAELDAGSRHGTALCRRAVRDAEAGAWSAPEAEVADVVRRRGCRPACSTRLCTWTVRSSVSRTAGSPAWAWAGRSRAAGITPADAAFDATLARHDWFAGHGLQLLHVTPRRARSMGSRYAEMLAAAVAARRRAAVPEPPGLVVRPYDPRAQRPALSRGA